VVCGDKPTHQLTKNRLHICTFEGKRMGDGEEVETRPVVMLTTWGMERRRRTGRRRTQRKERYEVCNRARRSR
jgi:hypothetical protein